ncbi:hypothetical protein Aperf_G00000061262 [Anoplocephala perfoliata]
MRLTKITFTICVLQIISTLPIRSVEQDEVPPSDWMAHLPEKVTKLSLAQIAIPGTHNSGTYSIKESSPVSPDMDFETLADLFSLVFNVQIPSWSVTQETNFTTQLQAGIRFFDFRVALKHDTCEGLWSNSSADIYPCFYIVHGQYANRVNYELEIIKNFLTDHPKEVIIIDFQHFYSTDENTMRIFMEMVEKKAGDFDRASKILTIDEGRRLIDMAEIFNSTAMAEYEKSEGLEKVPEKSIQHLDDEQ